MDRSQLEEGPETPAHLFAIRALRTAFFGTPAPTRDNSDKPGGSKIATDLQSKPGPEPPILLPANPMSSTVASPGKSILITPGTTTAATRRKTVSFSGLRNEIKVSPEEVTSTSRAQSTEAANTATDSASQDPRRTLFRTHSEPWQRTIPSSTDAPSLEISTKSGRQESRSPEPLNLTPNADETVDLKLPRSRSGQHWKQEYQKEHDKSKTEMQKLIRYSQIAKSYALKRDDEAVRMREKLLEAEAKVEEMERKVEVLAGGLARAKEQDDVQADLVDQLAKQTAQALRYKQRAEKYQAALEHNERLQTVGPGPVDHTETEKIQKHATLLEEENARLKKTVNRIREDVKRNEERHKAWAQERKQKEEKAHARKKNLQEQLHNVRKENKRLIAELRGKEADRNARPTGTTAEKSDRAGFDHSLPALSRSSATFGQDQPLGDLPNGRDPARRASRQARALTKNEASKEVTGLQHSRREKLPSKSVPAQDETMDLCNLPTRRSKSNLHLEPGSEQVSSRNRELSSRPVSYSSPAERMAKEAAEGMRSTASTEHEQSKSLRSKRLSERVLAAREDWAGILPDMEKLRSRQEISKENIRPIVAA